LVSMVCPVVAMVYPVVARVGEVVVGAAPQVARQEVGPRPSQQGQ